MAMEDTKVRDKKGRRVLVLRSSVRDLVNGIQQFESDIAALNNVNPVDEGDEGGQI